MIFEIPQYGLKAYALFFSKYGSRESFKQSELDWIVTNSMKKKIFSLLLRNGWIKKISRNLYKCINPEIIFKELISFKIPELIRKAEKPYAFTNLSAVEIWSDYSYIQRSIDKSPYFIKILKRDLGYWKGFFNQYNIQNYVNKGSAIGEYIILIPVKQFNSTEKDGLKVESLKETIKMAKQNDLFLYAYNYIRKKYGAFAS